jgi:hypothetical protein
MRLVAGLSVISSTLARKAAGKRALEMRGVIVAYMEEGKRACCIFKPDDAFLAALQNALPDVYGIDERTAENTPVTLMAQAMQRAFPDLYAHVEPLVSKSAVEEAKREIVRQKLERREKIGRLLRRSREKIDRLLCRSEEKKNEEAEKTDEVQDDTL